MVPIKPPARNPLAIFAAWLDGRRRARARDRALVVADAAALREAFGPAAYSVARARALDRATLDADRPSGHWLRVKREIGRATGKTVGLSGYERARQ